MKTEPIEALKHLIDKEWLPNCFIDGFENKQYVVNNYIAEEAVEIAFSEGQSNPKIKELEWRDSFKGTLLIANTGFLNSLQIVVKKENEFMVRLNTGGAIYTIGYFASLDEAKQSAQADFEDRIKECLN